MYRQFTNIKVLCTFYYAIATRYRLNGLGIESLLVQNFPQLSRMALDPTQPPIQWITFFFPGVKQLGHGIDRPHHSSGKVKERVELYLYSPSGPSWPVSD
jgi:hypothetical protein